MNSQSKSLPPSCLGSSFQVLSGSALKLIAIICMLIDHIGAHILSRIPAALQKSMSIGSYSFSLYRLSRDVGRLAFPIFCFLIVEGFFHTRNRLKYGRNLLLFAFISELPWNYAHSGSLTHSSQNVFFTLFLGFLGMCVFEYLKEHPFFLTMGLLILLFLSVKLRADYDYRGYILLLLMYTLRENKPAQAVIGSCWLAFEWKACFAFLPINMYNGKRGFVHGPFTKYFFYAFYPLHLLLLGYLKYHYLM